MGNEVRETKLLGTFSDTSRKQIEQSIAECLLDSLPESRFSSAHFFSQWFELKGTALTFVFRKNLHVTNIQYGELLALIKDSVRTKDTNSKVSGIQFTTSYSFKDSINNIVLPLTGDRNKISDNSALIAKLYAALLEPIIVLDPLYGSCGVFLPPHLQMDLSTVCAHAGYVHSCGRNLYTRNVNKATEDELSIKMTKYFSNSRKEAKERVFFLVYAHEDFSELDRDQESELRHGLDDLKIHIEKCYMGSNRLVTILGNLKQKFKDQIEIPDPLDFRNSYKELKKGVQDRSRTIWLICDRSINRNFSPGNDRFYICYDQVIINENCYHYLDENKPAWIAHTTIPHTLAGAMINITKPWRFAEDLIEFADPFSGSGTIWLETLKYPEIRAKCSDIEPIAPLLAQDNLECFSWGSKEIQQCCDRLAGIKDALGKREEASLFENERVESVDADCRWAIALIERLKRDNGGFTFDLPSEIVEEIKGVPILRRLIFYVGLRSIIRNVAAFERNSKNFNSAFLKEANILKTQLEFLKQLREREEVGKRELTKSIKILKGKYSESCSISSKWLKEMLIKSNDGSWVTVSDARDIPANSCHVIVTDPPYGFNTEDNPGELANLYSEVIKAMVVSLKEYGHMVFCLPERSHTGRQAPTFTHKDIVKLQVFAEAASCGKEVVGMANVVPQPVELFRAPYFWESDRALRRNILHFQIRNMSKRKS